MLDLERHKIILCAGVVSLNCVDAAIGIANEKNLKIMLIASRSQVDDSVFGGGYANNWTTKEYAKYVRRKNNGNNIILARDHGGPWQNVYEVNNKLSLSQAMEAAKISFRSDIECGFDGIHIDASIDIHREPNQEQIINRTLELYEFCHATMRSLNKDIFFEIGTEEQITGINNPEELEKIIVRIICFCEKNKLPHPKYVVGQIGTKVMEMQNTGVLNSANYKSSRMLFEIEKLVRICEKYNLQLKAHNIDYLSEKALKIIRQYGVHAANIAPEFGVTETRAFISILKEHNLNDLLNQFIELSYQSGKWKKWMLPNSKASKHTMATISGHYILSTEKFHTLKTAAEKILSAQGIDLDVFLKNEIKKCMNKYIKAFYSSDIN